MNEYLATLAAQKRTSPVRRLVVESVVTAALMGVMACLAML